MAPSLSRPLIHRCTVLAAMSCTALASAASAAPSIERPAVKLQALDKVTARVSLVTVNIDQEATFGTLAIMPRACLETPPTEPPEAAAFLEIRATDREETEEQTAFMGWMFASNPAISALEHPVYDVWVVECALEPVDAGAEAGSLPDTEAPMPVGPSAKE